MKNYFSDIISRNSGDSESQLVPNRIAPYFTDRMNESDGLSEQENGEIPQNDSKFILDQEIDQQVSSTTFEGETVNKEIYEHSYFKKYIHRIETEKNRIVNVRPEVTENRPEIYKINTSESEETNPETESNNKQLFQPEVSEVSFTKSPSSIIENNNQSDELTSEKQKNNFSKSDQSRSKNSNYQFENSNKLESQTPQKTIPPLIFPNPNRSSTFKSESSSSNQKRKKPKEEAKVVIGKVTVEILPSSVPPTPKVMKKVIHSSSTGESFKSNKNSFGLGQL